MSFVRITYEHLDSNLDKLQCLVFPFFFLFVQTSPYPDTHTKTPAYLEKFSLPNSAIFWSFVYNDCNLAASQRKTNYSKWRMLEASSIFLCPIPCALCALRLRLNTLRLYIFVSLFLSLIFSLFIFLYQGDRSEIHHWNRVVMEIKNCAVHEHEEKYKPNVKKSKRKQVLCHGKRLLKTQNFHFFQKVPTRSLKILIFPKWQISQFHIILAKHLFFIKFVET